MEQILTNFNIKTIFMQVKLKIVKNENRRDFFNKFAVRK